MRCDQFMGLTEAALAMVEGAHNMSVKTEQHAEYSGMFGDEYPLYRYVFPDGRVLEEHVQAEPWSSGPVFFLALKDEKGEWVKESLWSDEEIERA